MALGAWFIGSALVACGPTHGVGSRWKSGGDRSGTLPGIDTSELTSRERSEWWAAVNDLDAPCLGQAASIARCVSESLPCASCRPAAEFLRQQILRGQPRAQVEAAFKLRFDPSAVRAIDVKDAPWKGAARPAVVIVVWADFGCPFCARAASLLDAQVKARPDQVRVVYKHFPLDQHLAATDAARATVAAHRQGKFWELHDALYAHREDLEGVMIERLARELGLDMARFAADMASAETRAMIERDMREADALGLRGTPFVHVNGRYFDFAVFDLITDLDGWIELELEIVAGGSVTPRPRPAEAVEESAGEPATSTRTPESKE
ncbi:MAG: thioredoxin domain-containing protein [Polyangiaceae bacterium]|nr:thioredoxin domain-containing protein [Polyangiaceae bacterium]